MGRTVNLFYLAAPRYGGWPAFTSHLFHAFELAGWTPRLYKVATHTEGRPRAFGHGVHYQNLAWIDAVALASDGPSIVAACGPGQEHALGGLAMVGAAVVVHDPTEMRPPLIEAARGARVVVAIRRSNVAALASARLRVRFIPHPYVRRFPCGTRPPEGRLGWAVSTSRVDFDKHTELIAGANEILPPGRRVRIHGDLNRLYSHHKLDAQHPRWRDDYGGRFPLGFGAGAELAAGYRHVVDMSDIKGDGRGGTQYTFLEAWDAGSVLVVNRRWVDAAPADAPVREGVTCLAASDARELARHLAEPRDHAELVAAGAAALAAHAPETIAAAYAEILDHA